jgi:hypothetical protein
MRYLVLLLALFAVGCGAPCKGLYTERDSAGNLKKFNEYRGDNGQCMKDSVALSQWESSSELRLKRGVSCAPQPQFASRALVSANNFYTYRDGKVYLEFNSSTGEYRKLTVAEGKKGQQVFSRIQDCFYERSGQILLDTRNAASSQYVDLPEVFTYTATATTLEMVRFDDSADWDYRFCPYLDTPWGFCDLLRNGNDMFFPTLTPAQQASTLADAILIRRQFNWSTVSNFSTVWASAESSMVEVAREDYKYAVQAIVDTPRYIDQAWMEFVRNERPTMPDTTSNRIPPICYPGKRDVTLPDGSTATIYGEICYVDGVYEFTQN